MKHLSILLPIVLFAAPSLAFAASTVFAEPVPIADIPAPSANEPGVAAANSWSVLLQPVGSDRGLKIFGVSAVLAVAVGRLRFKDGNAKR